MSTTGTNAKYRATSHHIFEVEGGGEVEIKAETIVTVTGFPTGTNAETGEVVHHIAFEHQGCPVTLPRDGFEPVGRLN